MKKLGIWRWSKQGLGTEEEFCPIHHGWRLDNHYQWRCYDAGLPAFCFEFCLVRIHRERHSKAWGLRFLLIRRKKVSLVPTFWWTTGTKTYVNKHLAECYTANSWATPTLLFLCLRIFACLSLHQFHKSKGLKIGHIIDSLFYCGAWLPSLRVF